MDLSENENFGLEKRSGDHLNYQTSGIPAAEWQFADQSIGMAPTEPSVTVCQGTQMGSSPCPSVSMVDSFCPGLWNQPTNSQSLGFLHNRPGVLPPSLSHFPTDSAFIERAARFSCFNGGSFSGMVDPFGRSEPLDPYSKVSRGLHGAQIQEGEMNRTALRDASMPINHGSNSESPIEGHRDRGSLHGVEVLSNYSGEPEFSGGGQEERTNLGSASGDSSSKGLGAKKRKRTNEDMELDQAEGAHQLSDEMTKENIDAKQKGEQSSSTMATVKPSGKQAKDSSDEGKEDYIHVRARRGQATNSHSLAERVRREKISERMKFLQDLVPGCSKVTGKAVMLDEIINYVQSLQRQVEFLSMKLAAVNHRLDFNVEGLLSKEFLQSRVGSSSTMGFSHDMIHPQLQSGLIQAGMSGSTHLSDALRRAFNVPLTIMNGYKETTPQMPTTWDDELHNVLQMNFGATNPPLNPQELNGKPRDGFPI